MLAVHLGTDECDCEFGVFRIKKLFKAAVFSGDPENFLYRFSTSTSERKDFYGFEYVDDKGGFSLFPVDLTGEWIAENFDSLISSIYNINIIF